MKYNIILLDDESNLLDDLKRKLHKLGNEVVGMARTDTDFEKLLEELNENLQLPDLAIIDVNLGRRSELSGLEVAQKMKDNYAVPFMFITSYINNTIENQAFAQYGLVRYILRAEPDETLDRAIRQTVLAAKNLQLKRIPKNSQRILVKEGKKQFPIECASIKYIYTDSTQGSRYEVSMVLNEKRGDKGAKIKLTESLTTLEKRLKNYPDLVRIGKRAIINISNVVYFDEAVYLHGVTKDFCRFNFRIGRGIYKKNLIQAYYTHLHGGFSD